MGPGQIQPNPFECAILQRIAGDVSWLRIRLEDLHVLSREYTGVGCYTEFVCDVPGSADVSSPGLRDLIRMPNVPNGMGAVLWCRGALPKCLEIFTYGEDRWDGNFEGFELEGIDDG